MEKFKFYCPTEIIFGKEEVGIVKRRIFINQKIQWS